MGATVTTGKLAAAFKAASGIVYVLFEETYEKNCHPHTPDWSCVCIGTLAGVMARIFSYASSCEGGSLQNRNGHITPEGYIAGWLKELANPVEMPDWKITLSVGEGFCSPIPPSKLEAVTSALAALGRSSLSADLAAGKRVPLTLHAEVDIFLALYGREGEIGLSPWRVISSTPLRQPRNQSLGYNPTPAKKIEITTPATMKIDGDNRLLQRENGTWYCAGWEYSIVGRYIQGLWETELAEPGSYRARIKAYREAIENGQKIPDNTKVVVDLTVPMDEYQLSRAKELIPVATVATATSLEVAVTAVKDLFKLTSLDADAATWIIPQAA